MLAGNGFAGYSGDGGPAPQAELNNPIGVAADSSGNVYIVDNANFVIRKVDTKGIISTIAGTAGNCGYGGDGGLATSAYLSSAFGIAVDKSGNVFIADSGNSVIREVTVLNGEIKTVAGDGTTGWGGDGGPATGTYLCEPAGIAVDSDGNLFIADSGSGRIREVTASDGKIKTVAGGGASSTPPGDGGPATSAELTAPWGVAVDSSGNLFIADSGDYRVREVTASTGIINTVAGNGTDCESGGSACGDGGAATNAGFGWIEGIALDSADDIFIADFDNNAIREVTASNSNINTVAGNGTFSFSGNGIPATNAVLYDPFGAASDSAGNIYIADQENCIVREVNATTGIITTVAGTPMSCGYGGDGGAATSALLKYPSKVALYAGEVYIADTDNCLIRKVDTAGTISTFAGTPGSCGYGGDGGAATSAELGGTTAVAVSSSGNVYIADGGNARIREVSGGIINTVAGNGTAGYSGDGHGAKDAELNWPSDVAVDASGNLYIADSSNLRIRKVDIWGFITTFAGNGFAWYFRDGGPATQASLNYPFGVAVDPIGDVLIADTFDNCIRLVDGEGIIHTVAGNGSFYGDGVPAISATLAQPFGVGLDPLGNIYVADTGENRVREVNPVAVLNYSMSVVTFYGFPVGTASSPQNVTLSAAGPLDINKIVVTGDFSESGDCVPGPMSGQCVMAVVFQPTAPGDRTGTLTIDDNGFFSSSVVIPLSGWGLGVAVSPGSLAFPPQPLGTTSPPHTVTVTNDTGDSMTMGTVQTSGAFVISSNGCTGIMYLLGSCTIGVEFAPTQGGAVTGALTIYDSYGTSPQVVPLQGTGISASLSPSPLVFGALDGGATSAAKSVTLNNYTSAVLTISSVPVGGPNANDFKIPTTTCGSSLAANSSCTYNITFTPSVNGTEIATLSVNDAVGTQTATLTGIGIGATVVPPALVFAAQKVGTTSTAKTLTLTNYLSSWLSLSGATLGGKNGKDFATSTSCESRLAPKSSCSYKIAFTPSVAGAEDATLRINDADGTQTVTLMGTGVEGSITPE